MNKTCRDGPGTVLSETVTRVSLSAVPGPSQLFVPTISLKVTVYGVESSSHATTEASKHNSK